MPLIGLGYRHEVGAFIRRNIPPIEAVEVIVDHCINGLPAQVESLTALADHCPVFLHGVGLSLGTAVSPDLEYLDQVRKFARRLRVPWYSEHLAFTKVPGLDLAQLLPLPRTDEVRRMVCDHVMIVQDRVGLPLLLENISYYFEYDESVLGEVEFLLEVCSRTGAGILLDLENLRLNSINHHFDPFDFLSELPLNSVRAVHLAGGCVEGDLAIDSHDHRVPSATLALLQATLLRHAPDVIIVERDQGFSRFQEVLDDVEAIGHVRNRCLRREEPAIATAKRDPRPSSESRSI